MLVTKHNKYDIVSVKITSGEEIVGGFVECSESLKLRKPLALTMTGDGPALMPYFMTGDTIYDVQEVEFNLNTVVSIIKTHKPFADAYTQSTGGLDLSAGKDKSLII